MDYAGDNDQALLVGGLLVELVLGPDWQLRDLGPPVQAASHFVQLLLLLLQDALVDGVLGELLQVVGEADLGGTPDEDLGRVVLVPLEGVSVVGWELVVEVVVALAKGDKGGEQVVSWGSSVVEGLFANPVGEGVDAEGGLLDHEGLDQAGVDEAAPEVVEKVLGEEGREDERHEDHDGQVVSVLDADNPVVHQVGDVCSGLVLGVRHQQHPADVRVPEAASGVVGVSVGVRVTVVDSVRVAPPLDRALDGGRPEERKEDLQRVSGLVRSVRPQPVVPGRDREARQAEERQRKRHRLHRRLHPVRAPHRHKREEQHEHEVQPVHVLVPVLPGPRLFRDVLLPLVLQPQLLVPLQHLCNAVLRQLLCCHRRHRLRAHQPPANPGRDDSLLLLVCARSNGVGLCDVNRVHGLCDSAMSDRKDPSFSRNAPFPFSCSAYPVLAGGH